MSWEDKQVTLYTIKYVLFDRDLTFEQKMGYLNKISMLDLTYNEGEELSEIIDSMNTEMNLLFWNCRHNIKKSQRHP